MPEGLNFHRPVNHRSEHTHADKARPAFLIVNADDYGYSGEISRGILETARRGIVTAIGIMANSLFFDEHVRLLLSVYQVDVGVHLNLTAGWPLTSRMAQLLFRSKGEFLRNKYEMVLSILSGRIDLAVVEEEWDAQIRRCRDAGLQILFLNSHEHIHMLPPLYRIVRRLADMHSIRYIRYSSAEWFDFPKFGSLPRELVLQVLDWANRGSAGRLEPKLLGVSRSGKLDRLYLEKRLATLIRGQVYELMCHPGYPLTGQVVDPRLLVYHDWEGELNALLRAGEDGLFSSGHVRLIGFRDLDGLRRPQANS